MPEGQVRSRPRRGLRLISFDHGGIRTLSSLVSLREILHQYQQLENLSDIPRPCDVFDLAGGTGTGGIAVIMLFRLRMSVDDAITSYIDLARRVFGERKWRFQDGTFKASRLEEAIVDIIHKFHPGQKIEKAQARELQMLDVEGAKCFVCAMPASHVALPTLFRSWVPSQNLTYSCTIVEAARATSASPQIFKSIDIGQANLKEKYVDGGLRCSNPVRFVVDEAGLAFQNRTISCVLSLGTGVANLIGLEKPDAFQQLVPTKLVQVLRAIAEDCESTSEEMAKQFSRGTYFRLNVDQGLQNVSLAEWEKLADIKTHTDQYLRKGNVSEIVGRLLEVLRRPETPRKAIPPVKLTQDERQAFNKLEKTIAISAYHNSQQRAITTSVCLPGTRENEIATIMHWVEIDDTRKPLLLVLGPAGSGKTSLLGTIARLCRERGYLATSFFFRGTEAARNTAERLINTIAYQIGVAIPELQPYISRAVAADPTILSLSLETRMDSLLIQPLRQLRSDFPRFAIPACLMIIDALDECAMPDVQLQVISILSAALSDNASPFRCVLSSRFNLHIGNTFSFEPVKSVIFTQIVLGKAGVSEMNDIRSYINVHTQNIQNKHPFRKHIPQNWPSASEVEAIVEKSGGQFIYAATVIRYVESPNHKPHDRLKTVLGIASAKSGADPFADLDGLYHALLSSIDDSDIPAVLEVLGIQLARTTSQLWVPQSLKYRWRNYIFKQHFDSLDADIVLAPLAPVLKCEESSITFHHLSFADFLCDSDRSGKFFVDLKKWNLWVVARLVPFFYEKQFLYNEDTDYLISKAKPGTALHQAIDMGYELVNHPDRLPSGGQFNIWPFVTMAFFDHLQSSIPLKNLFKVFHHRRECHLSLPILVKLGPRCGLGNSFLLFELFLMSAELTKIGLIEEYPFSTNHHQLLLYFTYLSDFVTDANLLLPEDYLAATLRCLWYLYTPHGDIRSALQQQLSALKYLPNIFGITNYLKTKSNNLSRGALQVLPTLLSLSPPSDDLIETLKQPLDNKVLSRTPSLSRKARKAIHDYLMEYDSEYRKSNDHVLDGMSGSGGDEPEPEYDRFLWLRSDIKDDLDLEELETSDVSEMSESDTSSG